MADSTPVSAPETQPPRKRRWRRRVLLGLLFLIVLAGAAIVFLPTILSTDFVRARIEKAARDELAAPFELGGLSLSWRGTQRIDNLRIGPPDADKDAADDDGILVIRSARVDAGLVDLLSGDGPLTIVVDGVDALVHRDADGVFNFEKALPRPQEPRPPQDKDPQGPGDELPPDKGPGGDSPGKDDEPGPPDPDGGPIEVPSIPRAITFELKDSRLRYRDDASGKTVEFTSIEMSATIDSNQARVSARAVGKGTEEIPESAKLKLDLLVEGLERATSIKDLSLSGSVAVEGRIEHGDVFVDSALAEFSMKDGKLVAKNVVAKVNDGELRGGEIFADLSQQPIPFKIEGTVSGAHARRDVTPFLAYVLPFVASKQPGEFRGQLEARLALEGKGFSEADLKEHLKGSGLVRVRESRIVGSNLIGELSRFVGQDFGELLVSEMGSDFQIAEGQVLTKNLFLKPREGGKLRNLGLEGTTYLDGRLDFGVNISELEDTIGDKKILRILRVAKKVLGDDVLPLKLGGTLTDPKLVLATDLLGAAAEAKPEDLLGGVIDLVKGRHEEREKEKAEKKERRREKKEAAKDNEREAQASEAPKASETSKASETPRQNEAAQERREADVVAAERAPRPQTATKLKEVLHLKKPKEKIRRDLDPSGKPLTVGALCTPESENGVVIAHGDAAFGYSLFLGDGYPCFSVRNQGKLTQARATEKVTLGQLIHLAGVLRADGTLQLLVDGEVLASAAGELLAKKPEDGVSIGADTGPHVGGYETDMTFEGTLRAIRVYWGVLGPKAFKKWAKRRSKRK